MNALDRFGNMIKRMLLRLFLLGLVLYVAVMF